MTQRTSAGMHEAALRPLIVAGDFLLIGAMARLWMRLWLTVYPQARSVVTWAFQDEIAEPSTMARWGRTLGFLIHLPFFAAAQSDAESDPATRTSGEPPEPATVGGPSGRSRRARDSARRFVGAAAMAVFSVLAAAMWVRTFGTMFDLLDGSRGLRFDDVLSLTLMIAVATAPVALLLERRRQTPEQTGEQAGARAEMGIAWRAALVAFGALALLAWLRVMGAYVELLDGRPVFSISETAGMALMAVVGAVPLAYVVQRRRRSGAAAR